MNDTQAPATRPDLPVKAEVGFGKLRPVVTLHPVRPEVAEDFWRHFDLAPAAAGAPFAYTLLPASGVSVTSLDLTDGEFADDELLQLQDGRRHAAPPPSDGAVGASLAHGGGRRPGRVIS